MNEIMTVGVNAIANKELKTATKNILNYLAANEKNSFKVSIEINKVIDRNLWKDDFEKLSDYVEKFFGLKQAQAYNLSRIVDRFFAVENGEFKPFSKWANDKDGDFSVTKLIRLTSVDDEVIESWIKCGVLHQSMSVKEIETLVKSWQDSQQDEDTEAQEVVEDVEKEDEITETEALEFFNRAYETLKMIVTEFNFEKLDKQVEILNGYAKANF